MIYLLFVCLIIFQIIKLTYSLTDLPQILIEDLGRLGMFLAWFEHFKLRNFTGSHSTFEFPSCVNLSGPSLYCIARTLDK